MGEPVTYIPEPDPFWRENAKRVIGESITNIDDTARQLIVVTSVLEGLYFHAISFSDLRLNISGWMVAVFIAPIALWVLCLLSAVWTLIPITYRMNIRSSRSSKETFEDIVYLKYIRIKIAVYFLAISFVPLMGAVYFYLTYKF